MRIGFFGGGPQALCALKTVFGMPDVEICFVHPRTQDDVIITEFCSIHGTKLLDVPNINEEEAINEIRKFDVDLLLSMNCKQIFKSELLSLPRLGSVNIHNGLLPRQRGGGGAYVGLINGETCGTTAHFIDEGIDDGDIIEQIPVEVDDDTTMGELQQRFVENTPALVSEVFERLKAGTIERRSQKSSPFYYVPAKPEWDEFIDWRMTSRQIFDRFRAREPGPDPFFVVGLERFFVLEIIREPKLLEHENAPGQVLKKCSRRGNLVKTRDTGLWISRVRRESGGDSFIPDFRIGSMLMANVDKKVFELEQRIMELEKSLKL